MTAREQLAALRAAVPEAERRVQLADEERRRAEGAVASAMAPLTAYEEAVGADEIDPDPSREADLRAAVSRAQEQVTWRLDGGVYRPVNEAAEARLAGARRAHVEAQEAVERFLWSHRNELAVELAGAGRPVRDRYEELRRDVAKVEAEWQALVAEWRPLMKALGFGPGELPESPVHSTAWRRPVQLLLPAPLQPEEGAS